MMKQIHPAVGDNLYPCKSLKEYIHYLEDVKPRMFGFEGEYIVKLEKIRNSNAYGWKIYKTEDNYQMYIGSSKVLFIWNH